MALKNDSDGSQFFSSGLRCDTFLTHVLSKKDSCACQGRAQNGMYRNSACLTEESSDNRVILRVVSSMNTFSAVSNALKEYFFLSLTVDLECRTDMTLSLFRVGTANALAVVG